MTFLKYIGSEQICDPLLVEIIHVIMDPFDGTCCSEGGKINDAEAPVLVCRECGTMWYKDSDGQIKRQVVLTCRSVKTCPNPVPNGCRLCPMVITKKYPCRLEESV